MQINAVLLRTFFKNIFLWSQTFELYVCTRISFTMFFIKQKKKAKDNLLQQKVTRQKTVTLYGLFTFTFTFSHLADAFIQSDLQLGNT